MYSLTMFNETAEIKEGKGLSLSSFHSTTVLWSIFFIDLSSLVTSFFI